MSDMSDEMCGKGCLFPLIIIGSVISSIIGSIIGLGAIMF